MGSPGAAGADAAGRVLGPEIPSMPQQQKEGTQAAVGGPGFQIIAGVPCEREDDQAVVATKSWPLQRVSRLQSRRNCSLVLSQSASATATCRACLAANGYTAGCVIGRSELNRGFSVLAVTKGGHTFAAKLTDEGVGEGILRSTLQREHEVLSRLNHRGIVRAVALVEASGGCGLVMERCGGVQLSSLLPAGSALCCSGRHAVVERLLGAVSYLHGQGVAHTDLHAANVMVDCSAAPRAEWPAAAPEVKIIDFGSARDTAEEEGRDLADGLDLHVNPDIRPPESSRGVLDPLACDVFALGLLSAGLAAGRPLTTGGVVQGGALAIPEGSLRLSVAGKAHVAAMLSPLPEERPQARVCLATLPQRCAWGADDA